MYLYLYILDVICLVTVLVLCVVDPLPVRPGACCITRIQHRESKSMFFFCFSFIFMLFTVCHLICLASDCLHAWKRNTLYSPSQCQLSAPHWNNVSEGGKKHEIKEADVGKKVASLFTLNTAACCFLHLVASLWSTEASLFTHPSGFVSGKKGQKNISSVFLGTSVLFSLQFTDTNVAKRQLLIYQTKIMFCIASHRRADESSLQRQQHHNTTQHSVWLANTKIM